MWLISFLRLVILWGLIFSSGVVLAQSEGEVSPTYRSEIDELLTVRSIALLPASDNVSGIYARPLEKHITELIETNHHYNLVDANAIGPVLSPEDLEASAEKAREIGANLNADAFIATRITKGPNGIFMTLSLFLTKDARLFAKAELEGFKRFELGSLKEQMGLLLKKILSQIPYEAVVLSRSGQRVTVNLGKQDGVSADQMVSAVQIIKAERHPKFHFIIRTEKELIGKIKILKVDETLSFGQIITEKEKGAIQVGSKISGIDFVKYPGGDLLGGGGNQDLEGRPDYELSFGKNPGAWVPQKPPTFGSVSARLGLGTLSSKLDLDAENLSGSAPYYPSLFLDGEVWLTTQWSLHAQIRQGIVTMKNPRSGGSPNELSQNLSSYEFLVGYNFRLGPSVWGPAVELLSGFANYELQTDTSDPDGLTTMKYSGLKFGIDGQYPVTADGLWLAGAKLFFFWEPRLSEKPSLSGSSENSINQFGFYGARKINQNLKAIFSLDYELYSSNFSGSDADSASQKHMVASGGLCYLF